MNDIQDIIGRISNILNGGGGSTQDAAFIVPYGETARWIFPNDEIATLAATKVWRPYSRSSRAKWIGLRLAVRMLGMKNIPGLMRASGIPLNGTATTTKLCGFETKKAQLVYYIGTPGPQRKVVCHLILHGGVTAALIKIPIGTQAREAISREARLLACLSDTRAASFVPKILGLDTGKGISAQTNLAGTSLGKTYTTHHSTALSMLVTGRTAPLGEKIFGLYQTFAAIEQSTQPPVGLIEFIGKLDPETRFPEVFQHGDFVPWNLRYHDGRVSMFDWEDGNTNGVPMYDFSHFFFAQAFLFNQRTSPIRLMRRHGMLENYLRAMSLSPKVGITLIKYYLIERALRAFRSGDSRFSMFLIENLRNL